MRCLYTFGNMSICQRKLNEMDMLRNPSCVTDLTFFGPVSWGISKSSKGKAKERKKQKTRFKAREKDQIKRGRIQDAKGLETFLKSRRYFLNSTASLQDSSSFSALNLESDLLDSRTVSENLGILIQEAFLSALNLESSIQAPNTLCD